MDEMRLNNGLPKHRSYYGDLIKSGRLGGQARKTSSTKSGDPRDTDRDEGGNPFTSTPSHSELEVSSESRDKSKAKNYAMRSKSLQVVYLCANMVSFSEKSKVCVTAF